MPSTYRSWTRIALGLVLHCTLQAIPAAEYAMLDAFLAVHHLAREQLASHSSGRPKDDGS